jgi:multiple sugar transport system substrate-binding protein
MLFKMSGKWMIYSAILAALLVFLTGCGSAGGGGTDTGAEGKEAESNEPVTLTLYPQTALSEDQFQNFFVDPLKQKYPNITLQLLNKTMGTLDQLLAQGTFPDIVDAGYQFTGTMVQLEAAQDLTDNVKQNKLDLNRFEPAAIDTIKAYAKNGELLGLPFKMNFGVLYYNKDLFDKFGVPYPQDGMTWDDALSLARKMTRTDGGTQFIGLDPTTPALINSAYQQSYVDQKTNKTKFETDGWKKIFGMLQQFYQIPGFVSGDTYSYGRNAFEKDRTLAMMPDYSIVVDDMEKMQNQGNPLNWDMVTLPNFPDALGKGRDTGAHTLFISRLSKHKQEAFEVLATVTTDPVQQIINRNGQLTILKKTDAFKQSFGTDLQALKGKNVAAIFKMTPSTIKAPTIYDQQMAAILGKAADAVALQQKDINSALRDAAKAGDEAIEAAMK